MFWTDDKRAPLALTALTAFVCIASLAYSFYYRDRPRVDAAAYDKIGWNLARGLGYVEDEVKADTPQADEAIIRVGPGYQFFLGGIYKVFGHSLPAVWVFHAILRALSVLLVYCISRELFPASKKLALLAAAIFGFTPDLILINGLLLSETFFIFLFLAAIYASISSLRQPRKIWLAGAGFFWALAILTRPTALFPFLAFFIILWWQKRLKEATIVFLFPLLIVGSWSYYATERYGTFVFTTTVGGYDLWVGNNPGAKGGFEKTPEIQQARETYPSTELDKIGRRKYFEFLAAHPLAFLELQLRKAALYFSALRPTGLWPHLTARPRHLTLTVLLSSVAHASLFIFGVAGFLAFIRERRKNGARFFALATVLQPLAVIPIIVETRYRYPALGFLAIMAAYWLIRRPLAKREFIYAFLFIAALTAYDFARNAPEIIEKAGKIL